MYYVILTDGTAIKCANYATARYYQQKCGGEITTAGAYQYSMKN